MDRSFPPTWRKQRPTQRHSLGYLRGTGSHLDGRKSVIVARLQVGTSSSLHRRPQHRSRDHISFRTPSLALRWREQGQYPSKQSTSEHSRAQHREHAPAGDYYSTLDFACRLWRDNTFRRQTTTLTTNNANVSSQEWCTRLPRYSRGWLTVLRRSSGSSLDRAPSKLTLPGPKYSLVPTRCTQPSTDLVATQREIGSALAVKRAGASQGKSNRLYHGNVWEKLVGFRVNKKLRWKLYGTDYFIILSFKKVFQLRRICTLKT